MNHFQMPAKYGLYAVIVASLTPSSSSPTWMVDIQHPYSFPKTARGEGITLAPVSDLSDPFWLVTTSRSGLPELNVRAFVDFSSDSRSFSLDSIQVTGSFTVPWRITKRPSIWEPSTLKVVYFIHEPIVNTTCGSLSGCSWSDNQRIYDIQRTTKLHATITIQNISSTPWTSSRP